MANYHSTSSFQPNIPNRLLTQADRSFFESFNFTLYPEGDSTRIFDPVGSDVGCGSEELGEDRLYNRFQEIIRRSSGELPWVSREIGHYCDKDRADGFGGTAIFITADDVRYLSTSGWLQQRVAEVETGDLAPGADEDDAKAARPIVAIVLEGGLVQSVVGNAPEKIAADVIIIDYDTQDSDDEDLLRVPQLPDGTTAEAVGRIAAIDQSGIGLESVFQQITRRGW